MSAHEGKEDGRGTRLKIAINSLGVNGGGGKTYLENFLPALEKADPTLECFVIVRPRTIPVLPKLSPRFHYVPAPMAGTVFNRFLAEQAWLPLWLRRQSIDLLYSPADSTSILAHCPVVLAMRNMNLYIKRDKGWGVGFRLKFHGLSSLAQISSKIAKKIIFVSRSSQETIAKRLSIQENKQEVVYHGVSSIFFESKSDLPRELSWLASKSPYLLSVSSIYRYKNYVRLIEAFAAALKRGINHHLIIAGKPYDSPYLEEMKRKINREGIGHRVHLIGEVPYSHLPFLYQRASLFVFPSYLETFGHPLVEAMASGAPILAGDIPNSREITAGAAVYCDPYRALAMTDAMLEVLGNASLREELSRRSRIRGAEFSWTRCAEETLRVFQRALC